MRFRFKDGKHWANTRSGLYVPGIDFGYTGIHIVKDFGKYLILKNPGQTAWSGVGMTSYYPANYRIVKVVWWDSQYTCVEEIGREIEPGQKWRACIADMTAQIERLLEAT